MFPIYGCLDNSYWINQGLFEAAKTGGLHFLNFWLRTQKSGFDINVQDINGMSPLMHASFAGHVGIVYRLVQCGANVNQCCYRGFSALSLACTRGHEKIVTFLCSLEPKPDQRFSLFSTATPLMSAAGNKRDAIVRILMNQHPPPRICDRFNDMSAINLATGETKTFLQCLACTERRYDVRAFIYHITWVPMDIADLIALFTCWY